MRHPVRVFRLCFSRVFSLLCVLLFNVGITQPVHAEADIIWKDLEDPNLKEALFDSYQDRHFMAITRLLSAQKLSRIKQQQERAALVLGGLYLAYGFHQEAANLFQAFLEKDQPVEVRDQAWFYLAKTQYQRGRYDEAREALAKIGDTLDVILEPEREVLDGLVSLKQANYRQAIDYFNKVKYQSEWRAYAQYNIGIAKFQAGETEQGLAVLDEVGELNSDSKEIRNLRDKANLVLGYGYLNDGKYDKAKKFLNRMFLTGRHANTALLALGRAYSSEKNHKQSLVPWLELIDRDPADPAVQDGLMGVPFAFGQLQAYKQSLQYYEKAMRIFQAEIGKINKAAEAINGGKLIEGLIRSDNGELEGGGEFTLERVLDTPEGHYLWPLIASHEFRESLFNYSQLRLSLGKLESWSASLGTYRTLSKARRKSYRDRITRLQSQVLLVTEKFEHHLQEMAYAELDRRKQKLVGYFNEARFSVAQIYDYSAKRWGESR